MSVAPIPTERPAPTVDELQPVVDRLQILQRHRTFAIKGQQRNDRARDSMIAGLLGYTPKLNEEQRKEIYARAGKLADALERGKKHNEDQRVADLAWPFVMGTLGSRQSFDSLRKNAENEMIDLSAQLPAQQFIQETRGVNYLGHAVIVGEAGDLRNYSDPGKLWKRFGLAPFEHEGQMFAASTWRRKGGLSAEEWMKIGFKPSRLGQLYGVITVPLFMKKADNKYGKIYEQRRAHTLITHGEGTALEWTKKWADNDARRYMTKRFVLNLWEAWNPDRAGWVWHAVTGKPLGDNKGNTYYES